MNAKLGEHQDEDKGVILAEISPTDTVTEAVDMIWDMINKAHDEYPDKEIQLIVSTDGHRNDEGGYTEDFHLFHMNICIRVLSMFIDKLTIDGLIEMRCDSCNIDHFLSADADEIEKDSETLLCDGIPGDATAEDLIKNTTLFAEYNKGKGELHWGFEPNE